VIRVAHRINSIEQLRGIPEQFGAELDLRAEGKDIIIHHDPFTGGPRFEDWLNHYRHRLLILNVKEEGLEERLIRLMRERGIENYFFLDQSFPFLIKTARSGEKRCAVRVSEFETVETALGLAGLVEWVWVDCFTRFPLTSIDAERLKAAGFKLCLVSPELQGRTDREHVEQYRAEIDAAHIVADAVCTKYFDLWG
jgi:hypothetical protein